MDLNSVAYIVSFSSEARQQGTQKVPLYPSAATVAKPLWLLGKLRQLRTFEAAVFMVQIDAVIED